MDAPEWLLDKLRQENDRQEGREVPGEVPGAGSPMARKYTEAALRSIEQEMRDAQPGTRNDTLNTCAFSLGTLGGAGLLSEDEAWPRLRDAALAT